MAWRLEKVRACNQWWKVHLFIYLCDFYFSAKKPLKLGSEFRSLTCNSRSTLNLQELSIASDYLRKWNELHSLKKTLDMVESSRRRLVSVTQSSLSWRNKHPTLCKTFQKELASRTKSLKVQSIKLIKSGFYWSLTACNMFSCTSVWEWNTGCPSRNIFPVLNKQRMRKWQTTWLC